MVTHACILALRRKKQEEQEFKDIFYVQAETGASLFYIRIYCLRK